MANPLAGLLRGIVDGARARVTGEPRAGDPRTPPHPYDRRDASQDAHRVMVKGVADLGVFEERADSWQNLTTGMGDPNRDKLMGGYFMPLVNLDFGQIESMYYGDDMCERIVDALPDDAFRRGFELEGSLAEEMNKQIKTLDAETKLRDAFAWGRLWGGCALVLGIDDGQVQTQPLDVERVRGVKFINVVDRRYVNPLRYYEGALSPKFGEPETYSVTPAFGRAAMGVEIHETRLIRFYGTKIDAITTRRLAGWSYSVLQRPYDVLRLFSTAFQSAGQLASDAGQGVFSIANLMGQLGSSQKNAILQRLQMMDMQRSSGRSILVDKDKEEFKRHAVQVAGVDKLLEHFEMRLAAAARMPVTMLMGRAPAGMDATGEGDAKQWHAQVKAAQTKTVEPALVRLLDILSAGKWSHDDANKINWLAQEDPNDKEEAEVEKLEAETFKIYSDMGALSGEQITLIKFAGKAVGEVIDEEALEAIIEADYELAKNPPPPVAVAPGMKPPAGAAPNGTPRGPQPPPGAGQAPPPAAR